MTGSLRCSVAPSRARPSREGLRRDAADAKERILCESRHKVDLKLKDDTYQRYMREGIPFDVTMRAAQTPRCVKVTVYDYAPDLLGSAIVKLK
jgi:hypothetical protein